MKVIVKVIFKAVKILINAILLPIDLIVSEAAPDLTSALAGVRNFFLYLNEPVLWVKSWLPFTTAFWTTLLAVLVFKYTVPLATHTIKVIVAWYNTLKP